jgi:CHASE3 domain sensor protein
MPTEEQKKANRRLAWILATVVLVFFAGFMARMVILGG